MTPAPPIDAGLVTAAPFGPSAARSWVTKPALSAPTIGTYGWLAAFSASTMFESTPDVQMPSNFVPALMMSLICWVAVAGSHFVTATC